jgi:hypothetical protein
MGDTSQTADQNWWESLNHGGLLIGPKQLTKYFPETPARLNAWTVEQLRRHLNRFDAATKVDERRAALSDLLTVVLEKVVGIDEELGTWRKDVGSDWSRNLVTGESFKPRRVWTHPGGTAFPIFVAEDERLGIGRGVRSVSKVLEWLRKGSERIALLTNGRQWRLIHAGLDHDAWAQWDTDQWLAEGEPGPQVAALQILLHPSKLLPAKAGELSPLLAAIDETRKGQAEVSAELGERVRKAVELLIQAHAIALDEKGGELARKDVYLAAVRMVMRMVVVLFAEARDLLPRDNSLYFGSYGLQGLRETLRRAAGGRLQRLRTRNGAWPRVLALFRLVYQGSPHRALPVPRYGGDLFRRGEPEPDAKVSDAGIRKAVHLFETACFQYEVSDAVVYEILEKITTTHVRVPQGSAAKVVPVPVNFADLSTEYIGMLYEGLLGYELRRVEDEDEAIVFLNLGDQPALPLRRLEAMDDKALVNLVDKFKQKAAAVSASDEEDDEDEAEDEAEENAEAAENDPETEALEPEVDDGEQAVDEVDNRQGIRDRAIGWAKRAVVAGKLVSKPKSTKGNAQADFEQKIVEKAKQITGTAYLSGQYFLIRSSGTRKGSGTFYTRPALAIPTAHRTLRPLAYVAPNGDDGQPNELAPAADWAPRTPEEILGLKVCDPACGSASFLVAALRFLTDALYASLHHHGRIREQGDGALVTLAEGKESAGSLAEETLPSRPDDPSFEVRLKARLKRYVVERCIYGVDQDRLAIELARMALWIETMDRDLPFEFLDHKIKHGNALVGTWFDHFSMYPILAWAREGGDKSHSRFVHHFRTTMSKQGKESKAGDPWNVALKEFYKNTAKPRYRDWLDGKVGLWDQVRPDDARKQHEEAVRLFEELHAIPVHDSEARRAFYQETIVGSASYRTLKEAFDTWCAIWFWPPDKVQYVPVATGAVDAENLKAIVASVRHQLHFFHWELEFPDVFRTKGAGFDALLGNPPWEISKPNSREFFSRIDPLYRSYGKQEALDKQKEFFERSERDEAEWIRYNDFFKAMSNWTSHAASPFGDGAADGERISFSRSTSENEQYRHVVASRRSSGLSFADPRHPFRHQGSADINLYKMFLELSHALTRERGRVGMIVPSGIYTDKGTTALRRLFLDECRWRWLFGFENSRRIFDIHRSYKFNPLIVEKGGTTDAILTAFMRRDVRDWEEAERLATAYTREQVDRFSPKAKAVLEIGGQRDLEILATIYSNAALIADQSANGWRVKYRAEFHMTSDAWRFKTLPWWEQQGYQRDSSGRWLGTDGKAALPLYQGAMIHQFNANYARFDGKQWVNQTTSVPVVEPKFLMSAEHFNSPTIARVGFRDIARTTDQRTMIAAVLPPMPAGNKVPTLSTPYPLALVGVLNSFIFDWLQRQRQGAASVNFYILEEQPLPRYSEHIGDALAIVVARLNFTLPAFKPYRQLVDPALQSHGLSTEAFWSLPAPSEFERKVLRGLTEAVVTAWYGLSSLDLAWILRDCRYESEELANRTFVSSLNARGFWRVDKDLPPNDRLPAMAVASAAWHDRNIARGDLFEALRAVVSRACSRFASDFEAVKAVEADA